MKKPPQLLFDGTFMRKSMETPELKVTATEIYDNWFCKKNYGLISSEQTKINKKNIRRKTGGVYGRYRVENFQEDIIIGLNNSHTAIIFMFESQFEEHRKEFTDDSTDC